MCTVEKRGQVFVLTLTGDGEHCLSPSIIAISAPRWHASAPKPSPSLSAAPPSSPPPTASSSPTDSTSPPPPRPPPPPRAARLYSMFDVFAPLVADLVSLPMPTVAAVTGHAAAAVLMLALAHDFVVMRGDREVLYLSEADMGLQPYFLSIMREKVRDFEVFKDMVMKARKIGAKEAAEGGVVDLVKGSAEETVAAMTE